MSSSFPTRPIHHNILLDLQDIRSLVAETTRSALHCAEGVSQPGVAPEDITLQAA
jgi:hypothetical protein